VGAPTPLAATLGEGRMFRTVEQAVDAFKQGKTTT
jgi:hypothetical protein